MFIKTYHNMFILTLIFGSLVAVSANSWFTSWLGLEINLMSMIPLMLMNASKPLTEAALKYFLVQAIASTLLISTVAIYTILNNYLTMESTEILIFSSLMIKAGVPPFHLWFPEVANKLKWFQCLILFTWQKLAPLLLMSCFSMNKIVAAMALAVTIGSLGGLNQIVLKPLFSYSSISHSGWIIGAASSSLSNWLNYFLIYSFLTASIFLPLSASPAKKINELIKWPHSLIMKCSLSFTILSLGGLPPFLGFMAKLSVLIFLIKLNLMTLLLIMVMFSLVSLYYYTRLIYAFMLTTPAVKWLTASKNHTSKNFVLIAPITLNILIPLIFISS